eukprot:Blabericola_migrator_1__9479@NODE_5146_length_863_cov_2_474874_g3271_i0_p1_GENE_NODE_5146_length_863_cov_2_474874_g3271_i0NODE_5146_length_863_cov_2_474874_g3271_i0_p1_ORF_typecomplete_len120_score9_47_NODE_5146_length_863_cov_2_474874_g3271_i067426
MNLKVMLSSGVSYILPPVSQIAHLWTTYLSSGCGVQPDPVSLVGPWHYRVTPVIEYQSGTDNSVADWRCRKKRNQQQDSLSLQMECRMNASPCTTSSFTSVLIHQLIPPHQCGCRIPYT